MNRQSYMDNLRACLMFSGVLMHSMLFLSASKLYGYWPIKNPQTSSVYHILVIFIHIFYMPLFYLIGGYFSHHIFKKYGAIQFLKKRFARIGIPLLIGFGLLTLYHLGFFFSYLQTGKKLSWYDIYVIFRDVGPLWFIYYLLFFYLMALVCQSTTKLCRKQPIHFSFFLVLSLFIIFDLSIFFIWQLKFLLPPLTLTIQFSVLLFYFSFFWFGWLCFSKPNYFSTISRYHVLFLIVGIIGYAAFTLISNKYFLMFINPINAWFLTLGFLGLFYRFFTAKNHTLRYLADASYWIYLVEVPVILAFQSYFVFLHLPMFLKLFYVLVLSTIILVLSYQLMVRNTFIGKLLNGPKMS